MMKPPLKHRSLASLALLPALCLLPACNGEGGSGGGKDATGKIRTMSISSGQFSKGRDDGRRDAKYSLFEVSGGWMWLWMADQEYRQGYEQGWNEGRAELRLKESQKSQPNTMRTENAQLQSRAEPPASNILTKINRRHRLHADSNRASNRRSRVSS